IARFNGTHGSSEGDVEREVVETKPGDKNQLTVLRNKRILKIPVGVSGRSRLFAGKWEGTQHQIKFGDQSGNNAYGPDTSPVEVEISDDESVVTTRNPNLPAMPQQNLPNSVPDWWYHQDSRTLAWATDPQYQIELLG